MNVISKWMLIVTRRSLSVRKACRVAAFAVSDVKMTRGADTSCAPVVILILLTALAASIAASAAIKKTIARTEAGNLSDRRGQT